MYTLVVTDKLGITIDRKIVGGVEGPNREGEKVEFCIQVDRGKRVLRWSRDVQQG